jgi:hypothetical protein
MYGMKRAEGRKGRVERADGRKGWLRRTEGRKFRGRGAVPYFGLAGTLHGTQVNQNTINKYYFNQNFKLN